LTIGPSRQAGRTDYEHPASRVTDSSSDRLYTPAFIRVTLAHLLLGTGFTFGVHFAGFLAQLGAGEALIGQVVSVLALTALVLSPAVGALMDTRGRAIVIRAGGLLLAAATLGYLGVHALGPLVWALRVVEGVGNTMLYAALFTYAADIVPAARRTQGLALFGAAGVAPLAISGLLGDALLSFASYDALFVCAAGAYAGGVMLAWPLPDLRTPRAAGEPQPSLYATAAQRDLLPVWVAAFTFFFAMASVLTFMKTFVLASHLGGVGVYFGVYACVTLLLRVVFGRLPDRVGARRMVLPSLALYAVGALVLARADGAAWLVLGGVLCGAGHGYAFPVFLSLTVSRARPESRGSATALYTTVDWAGNVIAPPLLGLLIERAGYATAFTTLALILGGGALGFHLLDAAAHRAG
jgi:MFS family permease